jgi:hypothetical protein
LEIKVCVKTYRLFYSNETEDFLCTARKGGNLKGKGKERKMPERFIAPLDAPAATKAPVMAQPAAGTDVASAPKEAGVKTTAAPVVETEVASIEKECVAAAVPGGPAPTSAPGAEQQPAPPAVS